MKALVFMRVSGGLPYYNTSLYSSNYSSGFHIYKNLLALQSPTVSICKTRRFILNLKFINNKKCAIFLYHIPYIADGKPNLIPLDTHVHFGNCARLLELYNTTYIHMMNMNNKFDL